MTAYLFPAVLLAFFWGLCFALFLWLTAPGRFLRLRRTWLAVVIGVGVDLLIGLFVMDAEVWLRLVAVVAASAIGIIGACVSGEYVEHRDDLDDARSKRGS